jgi:hypothetical protein
MTGTNDAILVEARMILEEGIDASKDNDAEKMAKKYYR